MKNTAFFGRRGLVQGLGAMLMLSACSGSTGTAVRGSKGPGGRQVRMLLPLTGPGAAIGANMARAANLVSGVVDGNTDLPAIINTTDTPEGAAEAAAKAVKDGARLLLGPLRADQVAQVLQAAGSVPVVSFSNEEAPRTKGAFLFGVTPAQSVATMLTYAQAQGAMRIAVLTTDGGLGQATLEAARRLTAAAGMDLVAGLVRDPATGGSAAALRQASGGVMPDAVFLPDGGTALTGFARDLAGSGLQLMGGVQWGTAEVAANPDLAGAWFAGPPPEAFQTFSAQYETAFGTLPGLITALAYDAAMLGVELGNANGLSKAGLTRARGFDGALGHYRFNDGGTCRRDLAVMAIEGGHIVSLGEVTET